MVDLEAPLPEGEKLAEDVDDNKEGLGAAPQQKEAVDAQTGDRPESTKELGDRTLDMLSAAEKTVASIDSYLAKNPEGGALSPETKQLHEQLKANAATLTSMQKEMQDVNRIGTAKDVTKIDYNLSKAQLDQMNTDLAKVIQNTTELMVKSGDSKKATRRRESLDTHMDRRDLAWAKTRLAKMGVKDVDAVMRSALGDKAKDLAGADLVKAYNEQAGFAWAGDKIPPKVLKQLQADAAKMNGLASAEKPAQKEATTTAPAAKVAEKPKAAPRRAPKVRPAKAQENPYLQAVRQEMAQLDEQIARFGAKQNELNTRMGNLATEGGLTEAEKAARLAELQAAAESNREQLTALQQRKRALRETLTQLR